MTMQFVRYLERYCFCTHGMEFLFWCEALIITLLLKPRVNLIITFWCGCWKLDKVCILLMSWCCCKKILWILHVSLTGSGSPSDQRLHGHHSVQLVSLDPHIPKRWTMQACWMPPWKSDTSVTQAWHIDTKGYQRYLHGQSCLPLMVQYYSWAFDGLWQFLREKYWKKPS